MSKVSTPQPKSSTTLECYGRGINMDDDMCQHCPDSLNCLLEWRTKNKNYWRERS
jgi:hypothetical protein